jgi:hypothetical protein
MKARGRNTVYALTLILIVFLLLLPCMAYAANPAVQQKQSPVSKPPINPNAPPQGTITITKPQSGATWYTGSYEVIQWTCNGTRSNVVDVTLWQGNKLIATLWTNVATGRTAYTVPSNMAAGSYELRVTSENDYRVEARQPVAIALPRITITAPNHNEVLYLGSQHKITWTYEGNTGTVNLSLTQDPTVYYTYWPGSLSSITMANGQGRAVWQLPSKPFWDPCFMSGEILFHITIRGTNNNIMADSSKFKISCANSSLCYGLIPGSGCNAVCTDLQTDVNNCGACGNNCGTLLAPEGWQVPRPAVCEQGKCKCIPTETLCTGKTKNYCADLKSDSRNCGACGFSCPLNLVCSNRRCICPSWSSTTCPDKTSPIGYTCNDLKSDNSNCGKCGNKCTGTQNPYCVNGACQKDLPTYNNQPPDYNSVLPSPIN